MMCIVLVSPWIAKFISAPSVSFAHVDVLDPIRFICDAAWEEPRPLIREFLPLSNLVYTDTCT